MVAKTHAVSKSECRFRKGRSRVPAALVALFAATTAQAGHGPDFHAVEVVTVSSQESLAALGSNGEVSISGDGRFVAWVSPTPNIVPGDTDSDFDVFLRDRATGLTQIVSLGPDGQFGGGEAGPGNTSFLSADGRFVTFFTGVSGLIPDDADLDRDVFVRDLLLGSTEHVSKPVNGSEPAGGDSESPSISDDGRYVAFSSWADLNDGENGCTFFPCSSVYVHDRQADKTWWLSHAAGGKANGHSTTPTVSGNGDWVVFTSAASNLVPGDTNGVFDIFVADTGGVAVERVSLTEAGTEIGPSQTGSQRARISGDGRYVVFETNAADVVEGDTNGKRDVFVRDRLGGSTTRVSVTSTGDQAESANPANTLGGSFSAEISGDGRYVVFHSDAWNLATPNEDPSDADVDVFVHDRVEGTTVQVNRTCTGAILQPLYSDISADGSAVAFGSTFTSTAYVTEDYVCPANNQLCDGEPVTIFRDLLNDTFQGTSGNDTIRDLFGNDRITALAGLDRVCAGPGDDAVFGDAGDDRLFGDAGNDLLHGGAGFDFLDGGEGVDACWPGDDGAEVVNCEYVDLSEDETTLASGAAAGATVLEVQSNEGFAPGDPVVIAPGTEVEELNGVVRLGSLVLDRPLRFAHAAGETVTRMASVECVAPECSPCDEGECLDVDEECRACGRPVSSGASPTAGDALHILRVAVGLTACEACVCDVTGDSKVQAVDALLTLRRAVGQDVALECPGA